MVNQLAYVGAGTADLDAWRIYAGEVLGHQIMPDTDDHALYLRFDDRHHRLVISPADVDDVSYVGWEVNNRAAMDRAASAISWTGAVSVEVKYSVSLLTTWASTSPATTAQKIRSSWT